MNVCLVDIDSLRPDHVGAYGYEQPTTPNLDAFAADAVRFTRAYAAGSPCMPSRAALVSGRYPIANGVATHGPRGRTLDSPHSWEGFDGPERAWWTLPECLFQTGTRTCAVSSFPRHPAPFFYHLWDEFHQPREPNGEGEYYQTVRGERVADRAIERLEAMADDDFVLYAQFWDPHTPYNRDDDEVEQFRDGPLPPYPTQEQIDDHGAWDTWRSATDPDLKRTLRYVDADAVTDRDALGEVLAHYDAEIRYVDRQVGRLLDALRAAGVYDETLVVVTADHGEEFGEHGLYREHWSTHEGTQRVPLLVKPPAGTGWSPGERDALVTNVDLAPTVTDYADIEAPAAWQGRSLRSVLEGGGEWRDAVVVDHGLYTAQRAVRTDRWKFVRTYHAGVWNLPDRQLFDFQSDPWEQTDVSESHPDVVDDLERRMAVWTETHVGRGEDALRAVAREGPAGLAWATE